MGGISKVIGKTVEKGVGYAAPAVISASVAENYIKKMQKEGKNWLKPVNMYKYFGKTGIDRIANVVKETAKSLFGENEGGMAYARKKNMGLKMNKGGSVSNKKSRGTGAAIKGTKFKGTF